MRPHRNLLVVLAFGPVAAVVAVGVSVVTGAGAWTPAVPGWSATVALVALLAGIPHGAVDHLTTVPTSGRAARVRWAVGYVLLAALSVAVIRLSPSLSFLAVIAMSVWHFGTGDVEARRDLGRGGSRPRRGWLLDVVACGAAPLLLPLTSAGSVSAVGQVDPELDALSSPGLATVVRTVVLMVVAADVVVLLRRGDRRGAVELCLLTLLGLVATPLLAFAVYFTCWHALRHTARLAQRAPAADVTVREMSAVVGAGLPALAVTIVAITLVAALPGRSSLLGAGLAVVWGLTVPHMVAVGRFDRRRRRDRAAEGARPDARPTG